MYLYVPGHGSPKMVESTGTWQVCAPWHRARMTRSVRGDMQLTLQSVLPCALQMAMEKRP